MKKLLSFLLFVSAGAVAVVLPAKAATIFVTMTSQNQFSPKITNIFAGDTVIWTNQLAGTTNHSVAGTTNSTEPFCGTNLVPSCTVTFTQPGAFPYYCIQHLQFFHMTGVVFVAAAANIPPTVAVTNPPNNSLLAAPATLTISAAASDSDGTVTNVALLTNNVVVANVKTPPYSIALTGLPPGTYNLTAQATDNAGATTTSSPVSVRVLAPPALTLVPATTGPLQFQYPSVAGVNYVVQGSPDLTNFTGVATNPGNGSPLQFSAPPGGPAQQYYRVRVQP